MSTPVFLHFISYVRIKAVRFLVQFFNSTEHWSLRVLVKFIKTSSIVRSTLMIFCYSKASLYESKLLWSYFVEQAYNPFHRKQLHQLRLFGSIKHWLILINNFLHLISPGTAARPKWDPGIQMLKLFQKCSEFFLTKTFDFSVFLVARNKFGLDGPPKISILKIFAVNLHLWLFHISLSIGF